MSRLIAYLSLALFISPPPAYANEFSNIGQAKGYCNDAAREDGFSGVVLIAKGDKILFKKAYGFADYENPTKMRTDHIFRIGSLTKPLTASAALTLSEQGALPLNAKVCMYMPHCPRAWSPVTIHDLLSHSSGIQDYFGDMDAVPVEDTAMEIERVITTIPDDLELEFTPGSEYAYRNFNYVLIGYILEKTTGAHWVNILSDTVFKRVGMDDTGYDDVFSILPRRAHGYSRNSEGKISNIVYDDHAAYAAGGLRSTITDLFNWSRALFEGKLIGKEYLEKALTPYNNAYGYGWRIQEFFDRTIYNHTGGIDGFSTHIAYYPNSDLTIIVLTNVEEDRAILHACSLASIIFEWNEVPLNYSEWSELTPQQRCGLTPNG